MANHKKPTKEELQEKIKEVEQLSEDELEDSNTESEEEKEEESEDQEEQAEDNQEESEESDDSEEEEKEEEFEDQEEQAEPSEEEKERLRKEVEEKNKKLSASARENQKIYAKNRVINKALIDADELPEPTEEELEKEFPEWYVMSDTEKLLAKETVISRNWRKLISQAKEQATKIEKWNDSVDTFAGDPQTFISYPELEGKSEEFKEFAKDEENNSVPFKILVAAFLHDSSTKIKPNKGKMFERGSGGPNEKIKVKTNILTLEEGRRLRETNYSLWKEKLAAGLIKSDL